MTTTTTTTTTTIASGKSEILEFTPFSEHANAAAASSQMFQLQPANIRQYDPTWMTERLDDIMGSVSSIVFNNDREKQIKSNQPKTTTSSSPTRRKNPRKNRSTKVASPSVKKAWSQQPTTPRRHPSSVSTDKSSSSSSTIQSSEEQLMIESMTPARGGKALEGEEETPEEEQEQQQQDDATINMTPFEVEVSSLQTGADVIRFFARHGDECPVRFFYLQRPTGALDGIKIRPYDLIVVMVGQIAASELEFPPLPFGLEKSECFTMSPKGVVHLEPGKYIRIICIYIVR